MDTNKTPYVSPELLRHLQERFPNRCAVPGSTVEKIWSESGSRQVVAYLESIYEDQARAALGA